MDKQARTVIVDRIFQLGARSNFSTRSALGFARQVLRERSRRREGGDLQGVGYEVATAADAQYLGGELTASGWVVPAANVILYVRHP